MSFCMYCGKQIADGETCTCRQPAGQAQPVNQWQQPAASAQPVNQWQQPAASAQPVNQWQQPAAQTQPVNQWQQPAAQVQPVNQWQQPAAQAQPVNQWQQPAAQVQPANQWQQPAAQAQPMNQWQQGNQPQYGRYQAPGQQWQQPVYDQYGQPQFMQPAKKKGSGKVIAIILIIVLVLAAGGVAAFFLLRGSYKDPINDLEKMMANKETSISAIIDGVLPSFISDDAEKAYNVLVKSESIKEALADIEENELAELYKDIEYEYRTDNCSLKFGYEAEEQLREEKLKKIASSYSNSLYKSILKPIKQQLEGIGDSEYGYLGQLIGLDEASAKELVEIALSAIGEFENFEVTDGYRVEGYIIVTDASGAEIDRSPDKYSFNIIKANGDWMIDFLGIFGDEINGLMGEIGDIFGSSSNDYYSDIYGGMFGDLYGDIYGNLYDDFYGDIFGDLYGGEYGDLYEDIYGDLFNGFFGIN